MYLKNQNFTQYSSIDDLKQFNYVIKSNKKSYPQHSLIVVNIVHNLIS